jgi:hypothetical protein
LWCGSKEKKTEATACYVAERFLHVGFHDESRAAKHTAKQTGFILT